MRSASRLSRSCRPPRHALCCDRQTCFSAADVTLPAFFCELHLPMPLGIACTVVVAAAVVAPVARYALPVARRAPICRCERMPAGAAELGFALRQPVPDRDALVEDEALA